MELQGQNPGLYINPVTMLRREVLFLRSFVFVSNLRCNILRAFYEEHVYIFYNKVLQNKTFKPAERCVDLNVHHFF